MTSQIKKIIKPFDFSVISPVAQMVSVIFKKLKMTAQYFPIERDWYAHTAFSSVTYLRYLEYNRGPAPPDEILWITKKMQNIKIQNSICQYGNVHAIHRKQRGNRSIYFEKCHAYRVYHLWFGKTAKQMYEDEDGIRNTCLHVFYHGKACFISSYVNINSAKF